MKDIDARVSPPGPMPAEEVSLADYLLVLWRYRLIVLLAAVLGGGGAFGLSALSAPVYEAAARLLANPVRGEESTTNAAAYAVVLNNQSLVVETLNELGLTRPPFNVRPANFFATSVTVGTSSDANVLLVRARLPEPQLAARFANRLSEHAVALARSLRENDSVKSRDAYEAQMQDARAHLDEVERNLRALRREAQVDSLQADVDALIEQRRELLTLKLEIEEERARTQGAANELSHEEPTRRVRRSVEVRPPDTSFGAIPAESRQTSAAGTTPADLRDDVVSPYANPVYELLAQQVASGRTRLAALEARLAALKASEANLARVNDLYARKAAIERLQAEFDIARKVYVDASTRYQEARLRVTGLSAQLQIIDRAVPPDRPVAPRTFRNTILGVALATGLATLVILLFGSIAVAGPREPVRARQ